MIKLTKGAIPGVLSANIAAWTQVLKDHLVAGTKPSDGEKSRYRHPDIKAALVNETSGKCAYCESKLRHIAYGDVEHIIPKSCDVEKTFKWDNMTLACDVCNTNKASHFSNHEDLVDPYVLEPAEHFDFVGALVLPKPGSGPGLATESTLDLNRPELVERRTDRIRYLCKQLHLLVEVQDEGKRAIIRRDLETKELQDDKEFAAVARSELPPKFRLPVIGV